MINKLQNLCNYIDHWNGDIPDIKIMGKVDKLVMCAKVMERALIEYRGMLHSTEDRNYAKDAFKEVEKILDEEV